MYLLLVTYFNYSFFFLLCIFCIDQTISNEIPSYFRSCQLHLSLFVKFHRQNRKSKADFHFFLTFSEAALSCLFEEIQTKYNNNFGPLRTVVFNGHIHFFMYLQSVEFCLNLSVGILELDIFLK